MMMLFLAHRDTEDIKKTGKRQVRDRKAVGCVEEYAAP
jgi:hypothetical protein